MYRFSYQKSVAKGYVAQPSSLIGDKGLLNLITRNNRLQNQHLQDVFKKKIKINGLWDMYLMAAWVGFFDSQVSWFCDFKFWNQLLYERFST